MCFETEAPPIDEYTQRRVERYNKEAGKLNLEDGYNCAKCHNRGYTARAVKRGDMWYEQYDECGCMKVRRSIARMKASGLEQTIKTQKLSAFKAEQPWQKKMLEKAQAYIAEGVKNGEWFFIGGQSGSGKTMICTGIARELLLSGHEVRYVIWEQVVKQLKTYMNEPEYAESMGKLEDVEILYIDDLFKPISDKPPTDAELRIAFELLNSRYTGRKPTIISSERYLGEIFDLDEATGGRLYEMSRSYTLIIEREPSRNYRRLEIEKV